MDARTARYAAIACFGLAGALAVLWVMDVFEPKADLTRQSECEYIAPPKQGEILPYGDWCFRLFPGQPLHLRTRHAYQLDTTGIPETRVDVYDPDGRRYLDLHRTITSNDRHQLTVPWSRMELTPIAGASSVSG